MVELSSAAPIEVVFTTVAAIGFLLRLWNVREANRDRIAASATGDPILRWIATRDLVGEVTGLVVKASFVALGVWAMSNPNTEPPRTSGFTTVAGVTLIVVVVLLDANSALGAIIRRRVREANGEKYG